MDASLGEVIAQEVVVHGIAKRHAEAEAFLMFPAIGSVLRKKPTNMSFSQEAPAAS
jgi:hypothetical protein